MGFLNAPLNTYLSRGNTPYAVMINGSWGIGKTHYLKNTLIPSHDEVKFHYLSLYGISSFEELAHKLDPQIDSTTKQTPEKMQVVCLDDLERWNGNIDHCFSYINQIVEHRGHKCILIGNLDEVSAEGMQAFSKAQEKMIRQVYHFNPAMEEVISISLSLVETSNKSSKRFIRSLVKSNQQSLEEYFSAISVQNIRLITESLQLFETVLSQNPRIFRTAPHLAFIYLMALISLLLLVKRQILEKSQRNKLLDEDHSTNKGFKFLAEIGYFDEEFSSGLNQVSRILLDTIFYRLDKISLRGLCSIIKNGFYIKADFAHEFDQWQDEKQFELYLDKDRFYELENSEAEKIFSQAFKAFVTDLEVKNPVTLLLLSERVVEDIANGVIDYDPVLFKKKIIEVVDKLYADADMEFVDMKLFELAADRFVNCRSIYSYIINHNNDRKETKIEKEYNNFWSLLFETPELSDDLISRFPPGKVFSDNTGVRDAMKGSGTVKQYPVKSIRKLGRGRTFG